MKLPERQRVLIINLLIAVAVSLIVNVSFFIYSLGSANNHTRDKQQIEAITQQVMQVDSLASEAHPGVEPESGRGIHNHILIDSGQQRQAGSGAIHGQGLQVRVDSGQQMGPGPQEGPEGIFRVREIRSPYGPVPHWYMWLQVAYWALLAFVLLCIVTGRVDKSHSTRQYILRILLCVAITAAYYFLSPVINRMGELTLISFTERIVNPMVILKAMFTMIVVVLYGKIFELVYQKQGIVIENEQLKNENLLNRYNILVSQINPHFFFNSLNSLSMLVREKDNEKALVYIDRLSDTFRHIIQKGQNEMSTLSEELDFLAGYKYVHEVRYADKLFFDIKIEEQYKSWLLPALSLQPLIENAVKHNSITLSKPFHISIRTENGELVVSNPLIPKITPENGTNTGLRNLSSRYQLLAGKDITVEQTPTEFTVRLPLTQP